MDGQSWIGFVLGKIGIVVGSIVVLLVLGWLILLLLHLGLKFKSRNTSLEPPWLDMAAYRPEKTPSPGADAADTPPDEGPQAPPS